MKLKKTDKTERGQSMTELAISLVFLLILLAGVIDLGRAFFAYMAMRDAAQEGAAYGAIAGGDLLEAISCADIDARVRNTSSTPVDLQSSDIQVDILLGVNSCSVATLANACLGDEIKITVSNNVFPITMPFLGTLIGSQTVAISASVIDTVLMPGCD
ncbi:MAG: pilus assembly protein [Chloroflexi bacterium]|nr:pilus assembly protein [Chloroflexota bacterium]